MALTPRQEAFVNEYLIDLNATQAAIRAGYSKKTADKQATQLLGKTSISQAIQAAMDERKERTEITQDRVIKEIAKYAFKDASDAPESSFKHSSKTKYIDMLCKHLGAYERGAADNQNNIPDDPLSKSLKEEAERMEDENAD